MAQVLVDNKIFAGVFASVLADSGSTLLALDLSNVGLALPSANKIAAALRNGACPKLEKIGVHSPSTKVRQAFGRYGLKVIADTKGLSLELES